MDNKTLAGSPAWLRVLALALTPTPVLDGIVGAVAGAGVLALLCVGIVSRFHWRAALPLAVLACALLFWAALRLQKEADQALAPRLEFNAQTQEQGLVQWEIATDETGVFQKSEWRLSDAKPLMLAAAVKNDPPRRQREATVEDATAQVEVFDKDGNLIRESGVRWKDNPRNPEQHAKLFPDPRQYVRTLVPNAGLARNRTRLSQ